MKLKGKMKKAIISSTALLVVATIGILGGITYSKYFTKIDGEGTAEVARWSFKANNATQTMTDINLAKAYDTTKLAENKIAPGTSGSFDIVIDTTGADVAIDYTVDFQNERNKPQNLRFKVGNLNGATLNELENNLSGRINLGDSKTKTLTVYWFWDYETGGNSTAKLANDIQDTADSQKDYTFDVVITGTQVNPSN